MSYFISKCCLWSKQCHWKKKISLLIHSYITSEFVGQSGFEAWHIAMYSRNSLLVSITYTWPQSGHHELMLLVLENQSWHLLHTEGCQVCVVIHRNLWVLPPVPYTIHAGIAHSLSCSLRNRFFVVGRKEEPSFCFLLHKGLQGVHFAWDATEDQKGDVRCHEMATATHTSCLSKARGSPAYGFSCASSCSVCCYLHNCNSNNCMRKCFPPFSSICLLLHQCLEQMWGRFALPCVHHAAR